MERLRLHIEAATDAIVTVDESGRITQFNRAATETFGWEPVDVLGQQLSVLLPEQLRAAHASRIAEFAAEDPAWRAMAHDRPQLIGQRRDGTTFPAEVVISKLRVDEQWEFTAVVRDLSERRALEDRLLRLTLFDPLTGLPNRNLFEQSLAVALGDVTDDQAAAVLFIDIDRFKRINDAFGHVAGDKLLIEFASRLLANTRRRDIVGRFGGDEFVVVAGCAADPESALMIASRLQHAWREPFLVDGTPITLSASVGIAIARSAEVAPDVVLGEADAALNRAKESGRDRVEVFASGTDGSAPNRLWIEAGLQHAAKRGELEVHYQPIVDLADESIVGFEALVRWRCDGRLIPPMEFIPVAEETGQITAIGAWVLERACADLAAFRAASGRDLGMAVNLSSRQIGGVALADQVAAVLQETGVPAHRLTFEITETFMTEDTDAVLHTLTALRRLGVQLALDDFGTGYSSLSHLRQLPVSIVKIDRSFIAGAICAGSEDHAIVTAVVAMARAMGLVVTAEGIESREQADALRAIGANQAQGYFYARPMPAAQVPAILPVATAPSVVRQRGA